MAICTSLQKRAIEKCSKTALTFQQECDVTVITEVLKVPFDMQAKPVKQALKRSS